jgi:hypothetical protein
MSGLRLASARHLANAKRKNGALSYQANCVFSDWKAGFAGRSAGFPLGIAQVIDHNQ